MSTIRSLAPANACGRSVKMVIRREIAADLGEQRLDAVAELAHHARRCAVAEIDVLVIAHREISTLPRSQPAEGESVGASGPLSPFAGRGLG